MHQAMIAERAKGLDFFLIYPAMLKVKDRAQYKAFTSPSEAEDFVRARFSLDVDLFRDHVCVNWHSLAYCMAPLQDGCLSCCHWTY